jgi:hypothetical protein
MALSRGLQAPVLRAILGLSENVFALPFPGGFDFESSDTGKDFDLYPSVDS